MRAYHLPHESHDAESCSVAVDMPLCRDRGSGGENRSKDIRWFSDVEAVFSLRKKELNLLQPIGQNIVRLEESEL